MLPIVQIVLAQVSEAQAAIPPIGVSGHVITGNTSVDTLIYLVTLASGLHFTDKAAFWVQKFRGAKAGSNGEGIVSVLKGMVSSVTEQGAMLRELSDTLKRVESEVREMRVELAAKKGNGL